MGMDDKQYDILLNMSAKLGGIEAQLDKAVDPADFAAFKATVKTAWAATIFVIGLVQLGVAIWGNLL